MLGTKLRQFKLPGQGGSYQVIWNYSLEDRIAQWFHSEEGIAFFLTLCNLGACSDPTIPQDSRKLDVYHYLIVKCQPFVTKTKQQSDQEGMVQRIALINLALLSNQHY